MEMPCTVSLRGMTFFGRHGANAGEQDNPQPFKVDLTFEYDASAAAKSDALSEAVNYAAVRDLIRTYIETERHKLMESMVAELLSKILDAYPVITTVTLEMTKVFASSFDGNGAPSVRMTKGR